MNRECLEAFHYYSALYLASGQDEEWTFWLCRDHGDGSTPLMRASFSNDLPCMDILLPISDANAQNHRGQTALMLCLERGHVEAARKLILTSRIELTDQLGFGAFDYALKSRSSACQRMIGQAIADQIAAEIEKSTALGLPSAPRDPQRI